MKEAFPGVNGLAYFMDGFSFHLGVLLIRMINFIIIMIKWKEI